MKICVTGGAGFIGSHLVDSLLDSGHSVSVLDNFCASSKENVPSGAEIIEWDICSPLKDSFFSGCSTVFHLAADPNVKDSALKTKECFLNNVVGTFNVLEACRRADVSNLVFTSSSVVYGEASVQPTPENYCGIPISNYAASKLAGEGYCASYAHTYGIKTTVLRLANIFGERSTHGVTFDFYNKLAKNPSRLQILGDGRQSKSYLHVSDCVSGILSSYSKQKLAFDIYNIGSEEKRTVDELAHLLCAELGLSPKFEYTGGKKGWVGDVSDMLLDISKLKKTGWKPTVSFEESVKRYVKWLGAKSH